MPPPMLIDLQEVDLGHTLLDRDAIYAHLPQRFEFEVLDGVCMVDRERHYLVAFADVKPDDWWVRGHLPNRPLLPGVLMLEMAGQVAALGAKLTADIDAFVAFGGVEDCRFRETVVPPTRLYLLCVGTEYRSRRVSSRTQGVIDGRIVFEAKMIGVTMR